MTTLFKNRVLEGQEKLKEQSKDVGIIRFNNIDLRIYVDSRPEDIYSNYVREYGDKSWERFEGMNPKAI